MYAAARARGERLLLRGFQILALAQVANHGDHFAAAVIFLEPGNNDGGIEASGISQNYFLGQRVLLR